MIRRGEIWWAEIGEPVGSAPGYQRPVVILQSDWANATRVRTVTIAPLTTNIAMAEFPGNVAVQPIDSGLSKLSVVLASQITTLDLQQLHHRMGVISPPMMRAVDEGVRLFLDL